MMNNGACYVPIFADPRFDGGEAASSLSSHAEAGSFLMEIGVAERRPHAAVALT